MTKISFLSQSDSEAIHTASLEVLEKTGVSVKNESAMNLLCENGASASSDRVRIPSSFVEEMLKKVPSSIFLQSLKASGILSICFFRKGSSIFSVSSGVKNSA